MPIVAKAFTMTVLTGNEYTHIGLRSHIRDAYGGETPPPGNRKTTE